MKFETHHPGLFVITYREATDLAPAAQGPLMAGVEAAMASGPVALVFDVGPAVTGVDLAVPTFWLGVTARLPLTAMSIVTPSRGVRIAARGFKLAQSVRKHDIAVETHDSVAEAISWARIQLETARQRGPAPVG